VLKETLAGQGITVTGTIKPVTMSNDELKACKTLIEHRAPLVQALQPINTNSQNLHAEMLFRQLGLRYAGKGSFKTSRAATEAFLKELGLSDANVHIEDGSGLARDNRVTPNLLVKLLRHAAKSDQFEVFKQSLAAAGQSGTLEKRLTDKSVQGKVFAKTGYISGGQADETACHHREKARWQSGNHQGFKNRRQDSHRETQGLGVRL
jgi:D-alanyl-D-alanine carboxypeptidase/D-alanyl-D-alanine-endopeptidase (penicillin-binding protein 4)